MTAGLATPGQLGLIAATLGRLGYAGRDARLDLLEARVGRRLDTSAELTRDDADGVLAAMRRAGTLRRARPRREPSRTGRGLA